MTVFSSPPATLCFPLLQPSLKLPNPPQPSSRTQPSSSLADTISSSPSSGQLLLFSIHKARRQASSHRCPSLPSPLNINHNPRQNPLLPFPPTQLRSQKVLVGPRDCSPDTQSIVATRHKKAFIPLRPEPKKKDATIVCAVNPHNHQALRCLLKNQHQEVKQPVRTTYQRDLTQSSRRRASQTTPDLARFSHQNYSQSKGTPQNVIIRRDQKRPHGHRPIGQS